MAGASLTFDIIARDKASKALGKVGDSAEETGKKGKRLGPAVAAGAAVAGAALIAVGKNSISMGSDLSETINKTNVVFGANSKQVIAWSENSAKSFGLSQQAALAAASQYGDMFKQLGFTEQAALSNSTAMVKLAADLGSFHNVDPTDVLDRVGAALRGEYDSLQQLIPNINAARVEQEALAMTGKTVAKELTAAEKASATLAIVQRDGAAASNDFAETSGSLANQQRILSATWADMQAKLGTRLLPALTTLGGVLLNTIDFVDRNRAVIVPLVAVLGTLAGVVWAVNAAARAYTAVQAALNIVMAMNPIGAVIVGIAALAAGFAWAYVKVEWFRNAVNGVVGAIRAAIGWIGNLIGKLNNIPFVGSIAGALSGGRSFLGRATGGPVKAGQPYMVGERGPELIVPERNGYVLTADETDRALSSSGAVLAGGRGGNITATFVLPPGSDRDTALTVRDELLKLQRSGMRLGFAS